MVVLGAEGVFYERGTPVVLFQGGSTARFLLWKNLAAKLNCPTQLDLDVGVWALQGYLAPLPLLGPP